MVSLAINASIHNSTLSFNQTTPFNQTLFRGIAIDEEGLGKPKKKKKAKKGKKKRKRGKKKDADASDTRGIPADLAALISEMHQPESGKKEKIPSNWKTHCKRDQDWCNAFLTGVIEKRQQAGLFKKPPKEPTLKDYLRMYKACRRESPAFSSTVDCVKKKALLSIEDQILGRIGLSLTTKNPYIPLYIGLGAGLIVVLLLVCLCFCCGDSDRGSGRRGGGGRSSARSKRGSRRGGGSSRKSTKRSTRRSARSRGRGGSRSRKSKSASRSSKSRSRR